MEHEDENHEDREAICEATRLAQAHGLKVCIGRSGWYRLCRPCEDPSNGFEIKEILYMNEDAGLFLQRVREYCERYGSLLKRRSAIPVQGELIL
jgi:hypothetical protein